MDEWLRGILLAATVFMFVFIILILVLQLYWLKKRKNVSFEPSSGSSIAMFQGQMSRIRHGSSSYDLRIAIDCQQRGVSSNYHVFKRRNYAFNWSDNPSLIYDAVENGWQAFGFLAGKKFPSARSSPQVRCGSNKLEADSCWEVSQGSSDVMQKIRLFKSHNRKFSSHVPPLVITTALPLPGPSLGISAFPSEAYFEIKIISCGRISCSAPCVVGEGEKTKLIQDELVTTKRQEDAKSGESEGVLMSLGFSGGVFNQSELPGSYPGSVGFDSNGCVFLDGKEIANHAEKLKWGRGNEVVGCGFDPAQRRVFFTVSGELFYSVYGTSEEFGAPLYPAFGTSNEVEVAVNLGQSSFSYAQANSVRTANPCFDGPSSLKSPAALGYDDSKELFSIGRIDSFWLNRCSTRTTFRNQSPAAEFYEEVDADLFDIDLADDPIP